MANPTTNRPARPVFSASLGFGATCKSMVAFSSTSGLPIELVSGTPGRLWEGLGGLGVGYAPRDKPTGFTLTPDGGSPSLKFGYGSPGVYFPGRGFVTGDPVTRTMACVMRCDYVHPGAVSTNYLLNLVSCWTRASSPTYTGSLHISTASTGPVFKAGTAFNAGLAMGGVAFTVGHWYAVALSTDQTVSPFSYRLQVYDYTTQTLVAAQTLTSTQAMTLVASCDLQIGGGDMGNGGAPMPFHGQIACVLLDKQYWDATLFSNFFTDPWATARGTYTASGALAAPAGGYFTHGEGGCALSFAPATGIGTAGTGSPTYHLQRYTDPTLAPSSGARVVSNVTPDAGGSCVNVLDSTAVTGTTYWYRLECVDGSDTVYFPASGALPLVARKMTTAAPLLVLLDGDSRTEGTGATAPSAYVAPLLRNKLDRPVCHMNWGKSGAFSYNWTNGATGRQTISITGGTPTSGKFNLLVSVNGGAGVATANIAYNADAPTVQAAINATSANAATCTGGPLPGTPVQVDFNTVGASAVTYQAASSTLNAGTPTVTVNYVGKPADTTYFTPSVAEVLAVLTEDPDCVPIAHTAIGTNDMNSTPAVTPADYGRYLASGAAYMVANGIKCVYSSPPLLRAGATNAGTQANLLAGQQYPAQLASLANGSTIFYGGDRQTAFSIYEALSADSGGLHDIASTSGGGGANDERWNWADAIYTAVTPAASSGGGGRIIGG